VQGKGSGGRHLEGNRWVLRADLKEDRVGSWIVVEVVEVVVHLVVVVVVHLVVVVVNVVVVVTDQHDDNGWGLVRLGVHFELY
jgi:hypothetical protein